MLTFPQSIYFVESFETLLHPTSTASPKVAGAIASLTLTPSGKIVLIHLTYNGFPANGKEAFLATPYKWHS